jgi:hypothetical protein
MSTPKCREGCEVHKNWLKDGETITELEAKVALQDWVSVEDRLPEGIHGIDVAVVITGITHGATEYTCAAILNYRPETQDFIRWGYNSEGRFVSEVFTFKSNTCRYDRVTYWKPISLPSPKKEVQDD